MPSVIRVRDIVRGDLYEFGPGEPVLRGSYDLFHPSGPVKFRDGLIEWSEGDAVRTSRVAPAPLGDTRPGERVLVRGESDEEWWLCDVEAVDGTAGQ
jgi:hypothetical protein